MCKKNIALLIANNFIYLYRLLLLKIIAPILLMLLITCSANAQYKLKISDLNERHDVVLKSGTPIYFQLKNNNKPAFETFNGIKNSRIIIGKNSISVDSISWISMQKYHDNNYRKFVRNTMPNLHIVKMPSFDLESSHLAEIVTDTATLQVDSNKFATPTNKQLYRMFFRQTFYNLGQQAIAPIRGNGFQYTYAAFSLTTVFALTKFDTDIDTLILEKLSNKKLQNASKNISMLGGNVGLGFVGAWLVGGAIFKNNKATETALLATQALATSALWNRVLKYTTLRERPYSTYANKTDASNFRGPKEFKKLWNNSNYHSFASGHTCAAFAIATVFAEQYKNVPWVAVGSYTLAIGVGASRVITHKHWSSDVVMGAILGFVCGKQVTSFKKDFQLKHAKRFNINTIIASVYINENQYPAINILATVK